MMSSNSSSRRAFMSVAPGQSWYGCGIASLLPPLTHRLHITVNGAHLRLGAAHVCSRAGVDKARASFAHRHLLRWSA